MYHVIPGITDLFDTKGGGCVQHTWLTQTTGVEVSEIVAEPPDVILGMS